MKKTLLFSMIALPLVCLFSGCIGQIASQDNGIETPSRRDLFRSFREENRMLLVYGSQNAEFRERYQSLAKEMTGRIDQFELLVRSDEEVSAEELSSIPLLLVGTPLSNRVLLDLAPDLPVAFDEFCLKFDGQEYIDSSSVFCLSFYPNPLNPRLPLSLVTGLTDSALLNLYSKQWNLLSWGGWHFEMYQKNQRRIMGKFEDQSGEQWSVDPETFFDFEDQAVEVQLTPHYRFFVHGNEMEKMDIFLYQLGCESRYEKVREFLGDKASDTEQLDFHLYPSAELKGLMVNQTDLIHVDFEQGDAHAVINKQYEGRDPGWEVRWWLRKALGEPRKQALETGLSIHFSENWHREGYQYWAQHIFRSGSAPTLKELLDKTQFQRSSPLFMEPMAGSLVDFLLSHWGKDIFLERYPNWNPNADEIQALEKEWRKWMSQRVSIPRISYSNRIFPFDKRPRYFLKGFNFTHEGYQIYNGYISERASESLRYTSTLGSNAVSIVPYTGMGDPHKPAWLRLARSPGGENDESVIHMIHTARKLGMVTLLKPQVWLWQGSWPGEVEMESEKDWQTFFDYYYQWISHYALLAEMEGVDILCAGVEFQKATLQREEDWRKVFQKLRKLYGGKLTYSANWGEEFEGVGFWDELDYIGLNCYYPLAKDEDPSQEDLNKNCQRVMNKVEKIVKKYEKPLLFTEIGFRSVEETWTQPHEEIKERAFNAQHQAMAYEAVFNSLEGKEWCKGLFWWNWGTDLKAYGKEDRSFSPYHKEAERRVKEWYSKP